MSSLTDVLGHYNITQQESLDLINIVKLGYRSVPPGCVPALGDTTAKILDEFQKGNRLITIRKGQRNECLLTVAVAATGSARSGQRALIVVPDYCDALVLLSFWRSPPGRLNCGKSPFNVPVYSCFLEDNSVSIDAAPIVIAHNSDLLKIDKSGFNSVFFTEVCALSSCYPGTDGVQKLVDGLPSTAHVLALTRVGMAVVGKQVDVPRVYAALTAHFGPVAMSRKIGDSDIIPGVSPLPACESFDDFKAAPFGVFAAGKLAVNYVFTSSAFIARTFSQCAEERGFTVATFDSQHNLSNMPQTAPENPLLVVVNDSSRDGNAVLPPLLPCYRFESIVGVSIGSVDADRLRARCSAATPISAHRVDDDSNALGGANFHQFLQFKDAEPKNQVFTFPLYSPLSNPTTLVCHQPRFFTLDIPDIPELKRALRFGKVAVPQTPPAAKPQLTPVTAEPAAPVPLDSDDDVLKEVVFDISLEEKARRRQLEGKVDPQLQKALEIDREWCLDTSSDDSTPPPRPTPRQIQHEQRGNRQRGGFSGRKHTPHSFARSQAPPPAQ